MLTNVINIAEKLSLLSEQWSPKIIAQMNDIHFKVAKIQGEYMWHNHGETDEVFFVIEGEMVIKFHEGDVRLKSGELCVVPRGIEHKPYAEQECHIMLVEPAGIITTKESGEESTAEDIWI